MKDWRRRVEGGKWMLGGGWCMLDADGGSWEADGGRRMVEAAMDCAEAGRRILGSG